ncbi:hypothetical protein ACHAPO_011454 [Fusarium lateritium]
MSIPAGSAVAGGSGDGPIPPHTPGGLSGHRSERAIGNYLVKGDSDDESLDLPDDVYWPYSECIARLITNGSEPSYLPGKRASCAECTKHRTKCR